MYSFKFTLEKDEVYSLDTRTSHDLAELLQRFLIQVTRIEIFFFHGKRPRNIVYVTDATA